MWKNLLNTIVHMFIMEDASTNSEGVENVQRQSLIHLKNRIELVPCQSVSKTWKFISVNIRTELSFHQLPEISVQNTAVQGYANKLGATHKAVCNPKVRAFQRRSKSITIRVISRSTSSGRNSARCSI